MLRCHSNHILSCTAGLTGRHVSLVAPSADSWCWTTSSEKLMIKCISGFVCAACTVYLWHNLRLWQFIDIMRSHTLDKNSTSIHVDEVLDAQQQVNVCRKWSFCKHNSCSVETQWVSAHHFTVWLAAFWSVSTVSKHYFQQQQVADFSEKLLKT